MGNDATNLSFFQKLFSEIYPDKSRFFNLMSEKCGNNKLKVGSNGLQLCLVLSHIPGGSLLQEEAGGSQRVFGVGGGNDG